MSSADSQADIGRWHERAEEARATAEQMGDPRSKAVLLQIAEGYDFLAAQAEKYQKHRQELERKRHAPPPK